MTGGRLEEAEASVAAEGGEAVVILRRGRPARAGRGYGVHVLILLSVGRGSHLAIPGPLRGAACYPLIHSVTQ